MPLLRLSKRALSLFFRVGCERQFVLYLYNDPAREWHGMPPRQDGRAGLGLVGRAGYEHQDGKVRELKDVFGEAHIRMNPETDRHGHPKPLSLADVLDTVLPYEFIVEAEYSGDTVAFRAAVGLTDIRDLYGNALDVSRLQPDLIQVLPPLAVHAAEVPGLAAAFYEEIRPDGTTQRMELADPRVRLRVADIKMTSAPGAHYFAEVVFYSMALAGWLRQTGRAERYAVIGAPAVVPGSTDDSDLIVQARQWAAAGRVPGAAELSAAFELDVETAAVEAFAPRIVELLSVRLPELLSRPWQELPFHVDFRCKGCEFLGDPHIRGREGKQTHHPRHCWPEADRTHHLSRVVGLTRGAGEVLRAHDVPTVPILADLAPGGAATLEQQRALRVHHGLRARRTVFPFRAHALEAGTAGIIPESGGDALMPTWPDLRLYLFLDYDPATARTVALGCRARWREPLPFGRNGNQSRRWAGSNGDPEVFVADDRTGRAERREFLDFLRHLQGIFRWVQQHDEQDVQAGRRDRKTARSTYQIYLWDEAQYRHLVRLASRYLADIVADPAIRHLAWLFPPPELLPNPEDGSRRSPFTLVHDVVQNTVALPTPYHYTLIEVARTFNSTEFGAPSLHPLYTESMSNLVPPERIHEYWNRRPGWREREENIAKTNRKKLFALGLVVTSLERNLRNQLSRLSAPFLPQPRQRPAGLAPEGYLWTEFTQLNAAVDSLDVHRVRAMPLHEREARFRSAHLVRRLRGAERLAAIVTLTDGAGLPLTPGPDLFVYALGPDSCEFKGRPGDFDFALSPRSVTAFLDQHPYVYTKGTQIQTRGKDTMEAAGLTGVTVEAIDRTRGLIALRKGFNNEMATLARHAGLDFTADVSLDPVHQDYLSPKVRLALTGIGNPPAARPAPAALDALGLPRNTPQGNALLTPAGEVLWEANRLAAEQTDRDVPTLRTRLETIYAAQGRVLMPDQWAAWEAALSRRFTLVWGPPGTGKSHTLRAIILGAALEALASGTGLRVLITAATYAAVDNVLLRLPGDLRAALGLAAGPLPLDLVRLQSSHRVVEHDFAATHPDVQNLVVDKFRPGAAATTFRTGLQRAAGVTIVGAPSQQLYNLAVAGIRRPAARDTQRAWFDLIILDEASQMDVAGSTLVFSTRAPEGACVLAGDDLQLPPIHQAAAPEGLEAVVGSVYNYARLRQQVDPVPLNTSFRSSSTLIEFTRAAGYDERLHAHSPNLRIRLADVGTRPADWPDGLAWSDDYARLLAPEHPAVCVLYDDRMSAQSNPSEADAVSALVWLLRRSLRRGLAGERDAHGAPVPLPADHAEPHAPAEFWKKGVGVVVPHRAQMGLIAGRLQALFPHDPATLVRSAVDTVERFQGQERDVILASIGLGDPDVIASEEEFLYDLRRFNVMASRARAKLIVFVTRSVIEYLSDDTDVLAESLLLKRFAEQFCRPDGGVTIGSIQGELRRR